MNHLKHYQTAFLALALSLLAACAVNPVREAQGPILKAQAIYAEYVIAEEAAAELMQSPQVPDNIKAGIQKVHKAATPAVEAMEAQRVNITKLRITSPEDVPAAVIALNELILAAQPLVENFTRSTK